MMRLFKLTLTLMMLFFYQTPFAQNQSHTYDIAVDGKNVGILKASKQVDGDKTTYTIDSKSVVHLFGETIITTAVVGVFRNGILKSSSYNSEKDGHPYDSCVITESNNLYTVNRKGKKSTINTPIKLATFQLYFEKPKSDQTYFDILEAIYSPIVSIKPETFLYTDSDTNEKTTYVYADDKLEQGNTVHTLYNFTFTLQK